MIIKKKVPWWLKIISKIIFSRLPFRYPLWKKLGLFEHGRMNNPEQAFSIVRKHCSSAGILMKSDKQIDVLKKNDFSVLEIGPGDSIFSTVILKILGARKCYCIDSGFFATTNLDTYYKLFSYLKCIGYSIPHEIDASENFNELLTACNGKYFTEGLKSLAELPSKSIDFCFSNAVFEHIYYEEVPKFALELKRILSPSGISVHRIDLKDHLGGGLNNLRFSSSVWESLFFRRSGFYTNRLRINDFKQIFNKAGLSCTIFNLDRWDRLPIDRKTMADEFRNLSNDDLIVSGFNCILRHV